MSYGHEPYNLFMYIVVFVGLFWILLKFDKAAQGEPNLGLSYAIDMFVPLPQLRLDRRHVNMLPQRRGLQLYLRLHRLIGLVFAVLVFLFIYRATK